MIGDEGEVGLEVGSGHGVECIFRHERCEFGQGDGGGEGLPVDPGGGVRGVRVVEDGGEALVGVRVKYGIGLAVQLYGSGVHDYHLFVGGIAAPLVIVVLVHERVG
ncbi:hypothetical protein PS1_046771 [Malus domestica]